MEFYGLWWLAPILMWMTEFYHIYIVREIAIYHHPAVLKHFCSYRHNRYYAILKEACCVRDGLLKLIIAVSHHAFGVIINPICSIYYDRKEPSIHLDQTLVTVVEEAERLSHRA